MSNQKVKILCLDDEQRILNSLRALFRFKYEVLTTTDPQLAISILRTNHIAVVISDQRMPEMTGIEFLKVTKEISPHTIRILLTGFSDLEAVVQSVNVSEVYRFLTKPWGNKQLATVVAEAVATFSAEVEKSVAVDEQAPQQMTPVSNPPKVVTVSALQENQSVQKKVVSQSIRDANSVENPSFVSAQEKQIKLLFNQTNMNYSAAVLCKTSNIEQYQNIVQIMPSDIKVYHAYDQQEALRYLEQYPINVLVSFFNDTEKDTELLKFLKRELPHLLTIGLVKFADYEEIIHLINEARLYRYMIMPTKPAQLKHFIDSALKQAQRLNLSPMILQSSRLGASSMKLSEVSFLSRIKSFFGLK